MIVNDQRTTALLASVFTLGLLAVYPNPARADVAPSVASSATSSTGGLASAANASTAPLTVVFETPGNETAVTTSTRTVESFLLERDIHIAPGDFVSAGVTTTLTPGMHLAYRPSVPLVLVDGGVKQTVHSSAATVGELLAEQHLTLAERDQVFPAPAAFLVRNEVVRVDRVSAWTTREKQRLAPHTQVRFDPHLEAGTTRTLARGSAGVRVATVRYESRNDAPLKKRVLGYQVLQPAKPRIVVHGSKPYSALADIAAQGFAGALHFAGAALHVIATAYTSSCYGCSGVTATGSHAGLGIIAVDPRVIPLGTHLFIPGYGRAVAGDTGGAIVGHRVDLGFESVAEALRFGSREVTVYVVK